MNLSAEGTGTVTPEMQGPQSDRSGHDVIGQPVDGLPISTSLSK
jgi:hypothetical protein